MSLGSSRVPRRTVVLVSALVGVVLLATAALGAVLVLDRSGTSAAAPNPLTLPDPAPTTPSPSPRPSALPTGAPPAVPYIDGYTLVVDGRAVPGIYAAVEVAGPSAVAYPGRGIVASSHAVLFHDGAEVARIRTREAVLSGDGSHAAWTEVDADSAHIVVEDLDGDGQVSRLPVDRSLYTSDDDSTEQVYAVDDDGTVTYGSLVVTHVWRPGSTPVSHPTLQHGTAPAGFPRRALDTVVSPDGQQGAWASDLDGRPSGQQNGDIVSDAFSVQRPGAPGSRVTVPLPHPWLVEKFVWEGSNDVLVIVSDDSEATAIHYLRCDVSSRTCELAPTTGGHELRM